MSPPVLRIGGARYDAGAEAPRSAHITLHAGEVAAVVGPVGSGKSEFLRRILGWPVFQTGTVSLLGRDPREHPLVSRRSATLADGRGGLSTHLSVRDNVELILRLCGDESRPASEIDAALRKADIPDRCLGQQALQLPAGLQLQVWFAVARLRKTPLLLLDEPFARLEKREIQSIVRLIGELAADGVAVVVATRDLASGFQLTPRLWFTHNRLITEAIRTRVHELLAVDLIEASRFADAAPHVLANDLLDRKL